MIGQIIVEPLAEETNEKIKWIISKILSHINTTRPDYFCGQTGTILNNPLKQNRLKFIMQTFRYVLKCSKSIRLYSYSSSNSLQHLIASSHILPFSKSIIILFFRGEYYKDLTYWYNLYLIKKLKKIDFSPRPLVKFFFQVSF